MPYTVTASEGGKAVTATRLRPASACVLARKWADRGLADVCILWDDHSYALEAFVAKYVVVKGVLKLREHDLRTW